MLSFSVFFSCDTSYICMFDNLIIYPSSLIAYLLIFCLFFYPCFIFNIFQCCLWFHWFFKYKLIYFNWRLITLQYCIGFAIHQHESTTGIHVFPNLNPPPTSLSIPFLWIIPVQQPQASSIMHRTWTGDSFHLWYYTCFNAILPNHATLSLSHRVQKTVLYISVLFLFFFLF